MSSHSGSWFKHGFWNTLEHAITRGSDAAVSLVLLWALQPEIFAKLVSSQAIIAPILFFFIAPETILYRDYGRWKKDGPDALAGRLFAFRRFAWGKAQFALVLSAVLSLFAHDNAIERFWALVWAFALVLAPQISGPDREYLRLDLKLRLLNGLSVYQKLSLLLGTVAVAFLFPGRLELLAGVAVFSAVSTASIASSLVRGILEKEGATESALKGKEVSVLATLQNSLASFSGWQHANGVLIGWVQMMDLFFLSVLSYPGRTVGLYAAVLKVANFSILLPTALVNVFLIWATRQDSGSEHEKAKVRKLTGLLFLGVCAQALVIYGISPYLFRLLSHGRWSPDEMAQMNQWMGWILAGAGIFSAVFLPVCWLMVRTKVSDLFFRVYLPWGLASLGIYYGMIRQMPNPFQGAAVANIFVSGVFAVLVGIHMKKSAPKGMNG